MVLRTSFNLARCLIPKLEAVFFVVSNPLYGLGPFGFFRLVINLLPPDIRIGKQDIVKRRWFQSLLLFIGQVVVFVVNNRIVIGSKGLESLTGVSGFGDTDSC